LTRDLIRRADGEHALALPLTYNVVRLVKLIHLGAIERARMIYAKE
jgi:hypothetical protein